MLLIANLMCCNYIDIDECSTGVHNCTQNQRCVNSPGSFICECISGYGLTNGVCEGDNCICSYVSYFNSYDE